MEDTFIFIATKEEEVLIPEKYKDIPVIVTGVGALNAIFWAKRIHPETQIINIGYCGSKTFEVGTTLEIGKTAILHKCPFESPTLKITNRTNVICYSSSDFTEVSEKELFAVYDMELAFIAAVHPNTIAFKTVSDHVNYKEYERFVKSHT